MPNTLYFGTRDFMTWVPCPSINMPRTQQGWSSTAQYLSGGAGVLRSIQGARQYEMDWPVSKDGGTDIIHAFAEGAYGEGPFYFLDPQAMERNILPSFFAAPWSTAYEGPNLLGKHRPRPTVFEVEASPYMHPTRMARIDPRAGDDPYELWIPVPPGYTIHIGWTPGIATYTAGLYYKDDGAGSNWTQIVQVDPNFPTLTNVSRTHIQCEGGVSLSFRGTNGYAEIRSVTAVILPNGTPAPTGNWSPGKGHSGCEFEQLPEDTLYNAGLDLQYTSAVLREVGGWL